MKRFLIAALALGSALAAGGALGENLKLGDFEKSDNMFAGISVDNTTGKDSASSAKIENKDQKWVTVKKDLDLEKELREVNFWIKSSDVNSIALRIVDSTGQKFQPRAQFKNDGSWQEIKIREFTKGQVFEGAGDKKMHHPVSQLLFILEAKGTVWIDDVSLDLSDAVLPEIVEKKKRIGQAKAYPVGNFEKDGDGFSEAFVIVKEGRNGGSCAKLAKTGDMKWASAGKQFKELKNDFLQFSYWVKSNDAKTLGVRFKDSTGQDFQQRIPFDANGQWQQIVITQFNKGQSWGGANDKKWYPPAKSVTFILEQDGTVLVDDIEGKLDPARITSDLDLAQTALGNIFLTTETPVINVGTKGDSVLWTAWDFEHKEVGKGSVAAKNGEVTIQPPKKNGYFLMRIEAQKEGKTIMEKWTSYCVIPPYKVKDPANAQWGAMTHFAQGMDVDILPLLVKAGIVSIRDEHYWGQVEEKKGEYAFSERSDRYMKACEENGIDPLIAMTFGNKLYDHKDGPSSPEGFAGYGNYGQAILKEYGKQIKWLEIWNEYNGSWAPPVAKQSNENRYTTYTSMLKVAYEKIKAVRPDVKVLGCACVLIPIPYIEGIFKLGGLNYMDAVVIHPYRGKPEGVDKEVAELRELMKKYNGGKEKEIWVTETGRHAKVEFDWEKDKKMFEMGRQWGAVYLPRQYTLLLSQNVARIYWYLASDHMNFVSMGLLRKSDDKMGRYAVCPAYVTYATLIRQLDGAKFAEREAFSKYTRAYVMKFRNDKNEDVRVCWATFPSKIEVAASKPVTVVNMVGEEKTINPDAGKIVLDLAGDVIYLKGEIQGVKEIEPEEKIIASSVDDYGKAQGLNNWYYGYFDIKDGKPSEFKEMTVVETMWGENWAGTQKYLKLGGEGGHPGSNAWAVKRWKSGYEGKVAISGTCQRGKEGDGVELIILNDGKEIFKKVVGGNGNPEKIEVLAETEVKEGSVIDICISPLKGLEYDATSYDIMIRTKKKQ
ncbi:MAG TPA: hypothetical protein DET40_12970 [Lentisphaeria bacterium]|nr:MAG: hypothetical protein A2X45_19135 [Lentisphaerae bacterium GWF2_50_93]HCE44453.1 hypothetical protein [Lentisphaeria bacterium]